MPRVASPDSSVFTTAPHLARMEVSHAAAVKPVSRGSRTISNFPPPRFPHIVLKIILRPHEARRGLSTSPINPPSRVAARRHPSQSSLPALRAASPLPSRASHVQVANCGFHSRHAVRCDAAKRSASTRSLGGAPRRDLDFATLGPHRPCTRDGGSRVPLRSRRQRVAFHTRRGVAGHAGGLHELNGTTRSVSRDRGGSDRPLQVQAFDGVNVCQTSRG